MALPLPRMTKMRIGQGKGVTETSEYRTQLDAEDKIHKIDYLETHK